ncbi:hypothetical protein DNTS_033667 [Danionella cerebrum]|uniref:Uncharacterized protein n=1 Tax=Danionella cerebrum TaxID=2873325 RepID=A0A553RFU1_9TELE|nr:hypothetical protein DNTS_033667 [Danionella translucida]TRZ01053.1 hypothetical protein DNTS_033667 [Danionella translucida]
MKGRVTVYSLPGCTHCIQAKATLRALGLPVRDVDVNKHTAIRRRVKELTGHTSVPQIFFNNRYIGNNEDLQNLCPERLQRLVRCVQEESCELAESLRNLILKLYSDHLSEDGKMVNYEALSSSVFFERYCDLAVQLQRMELLSLSREETLAFFINIYNTLVIHGNLRLGFPRNIWQRYRFFNYVSYFIGGQLFTLQDIENGVLRGNRKGIAQFLKPFSSSDPRLQVALPEVEPLIHFALNCGVKGCPPIKTYTPQDIDSQLLAAAEAFLEKDDGCTIDGVAREVRLSQIFRWYKEDFGGSDEKKKRNLHALLSSGKFKVSFLPYDWSINSTR